MSGDVQPRKRKDKKKKKDEISVEEPRGTSATLGEGDVFMHSQHDHGTGGHWCAKIIFFSLLAVLCTLIGLIILENRGLSELEANSVESRYSGVLEGWIEDVHDDDHHDEHTLELKHHANDLYHKEDIHISEADDKDEELDSTEEPDNMEDEGDDHEDGDHDDGSDEVDENDDEDEDNADNDDEDDNYEEDDDDDKETNFDSEENDLDEGTDEKYDDDGEKYDVDDDKDDDDNDEDEDDEKESNFESEENDIELRNDNENADMDNENDNKDSDGDGGDDDDEEPYHFTSHNDDSNEDTPATIRHEYYNDNQNDEGQYYNDNIDAHDNVEAYSAEQFVEEKYTASLEADDDDNNSNEDNQTFNKENDFDDEEEHEHGHEEDDDDKEVEIERIEREITDDIILSAETQQQEEPESQEDNAADTSKTGGNEDSIEDDNDFLEAEDDGDEPPVEIITAPSGAAFDEIEEETVFEKPPDSLVEEEEYEKRQEELEREMSEASHHDPEEEIEEPELSDRRMTLIAEESVLRPTQASSKNAPPPPTLDDEDIVEEPIDMDYTPPQKIDAKKVETNKDSIKKEEPASKDVKEDKELYSDEDEVEEEEEEPPNPQTKPDHTEEDEIEPDEDDVEIIDEEQVDEELEEEEEISDVDDTDLLSRLEAKYGRLPEPERPGRKKDGGNSVDDLWPGEPSDSHWRQELDQAEEQLRQGEWEACERRVGAAALANSARARWLAAQALDTGAERKRDNRLLSRAINAYLHLLKMNEQLSDKRLLEIARRTIDRIHFRGTYLSAEPIYRLLIRRFPDEVGYRNNLTISFLMSNRADLAEEVLTETIKLWPNDRVALAHHGFILKNQHKKYEEAVVALQKALEGDTGAASEPRFYYHLGDALLLLGRTEEAHEVHKRGAALGHFLSPSQRSLYNVPRLKSRPWWRVEDTPYLNLARGLEKAWKEILKEGEAAKELYEKEKEGLKERGEWSQLDLIVQGRELEGRCARAPVTCSLVRAAACRRGQVKFSAMAAGSHIRAHVGPTNCRLRMHLGLSNTRDTYLRVGNETRQWQTGKVLMFDDSFEHEVWHNGTGSRLVLIVDVWHPDLTPAERRQLPAI